MELQEGDILYCYKSVVMDDDGKIEFNEGENYIIKLVDSNFRGSHIVLTNNSKGPHQFSLDPEEESYLGNWFFIKSPDMKDAYDLLNMLEQ